MVCFSCIRPEKRQKAEVDVRSPTRRALVSAGSENLAGRSADRPAINFAFRQLAAATQNFKGTNFLGEGGFGKVFRGQLDSGELVAVKQLNADGRQGFKEFITEVLLLSLLHHPNLVTLTGYCTDENERLLVYEFMTQGSLEDHLFGLDREPLSWEKRIKIAIGAARGMEYLHDEANPPVIYRDLKSANILLDSDFNAKLSDFGLAKLGPVGENTHVSTRVMGTYGYCAPEYAMSGHLTLKSDIFSFGVVLLEIITGRKAYDTVRNHGEQNIVPWAIPHLKDPKKFVKFADPRLQGNFSATSMIHVIAIAAFCIEEVPKYRPKIHEIVSALEYVAARPLYPSHRRRRTNSSCSQSRASTSSTASFAEVN